MGCSPFNSTFVAISDNPPSHQRSSDLLKNHSSRIHKTNPMEPEITRNIARLASLLAAGNATEENFA
jgi:hypothetical protein